MFSLRARSSRCPSLAPRVLTALALTGCDAASSGALPLDGGTAWGEGGASPASSAAVLADEVIDAPGATGEGFGDPTHATNGVRGGGPASGSLDVYSLDATRPYLVLGFRGRALVDGPGDDLAVFENPFRISAGPGCFMDPIVVSVSRDGATWVALGHDYLAPDERVYSNVPDDWEGFAGREPVLLHAETNPVDPFDRIAAGGDGLDLADLPADDPEAQAIRVEGARYVRLESASRVVNPDTGAPFPRDPAASGADVDGVYARWLVAAPGGPIGR